MKIDFTGSDISVMDISVFLANQGCHLTNSGTIDTLNVKHMPKVNLEETMERTQDNLQSFASTLIW